MQDSGEDSAHVLQRIVHKIRAQNWLLHVASILAAVLRLYLIVDDILQENQQSRKKMGEVSVVYKPRHDGRPSEQG
jgi:hypothetical protein